MNDAWKTQVESLGGFIRSQRRLANLTLREMAALANISNPYLSQVERGLHQPSMRVLKSIAEGLNISVETLLAQAGLLEDAGDSAGAEGDASATEAAIRVDPELSDAQKEALLAVYRSFRVEG